MPESMSRRQLLRASAGAGAAFLFAVGGRTRAPVRARIESVRVISQRPELYHGWPTVTRRSNGDLLVVCSGGREAHVCPFGWVEMMQSQDEGRTWSWPRVLLDSALDDRDAGVLETKKGTLLVTTFTSVGYEERLREAEEAGKREEWPEERLRRWQAAHRRLSAAQREAQLGAWMIRSIDGGVTWSAPYRCPVDSPHGPIQLSDGRLLYAGKQFGYGDGRIGVCESVDEGCTWRWLAEIPSRSGDSHGEYHELHAVEASDGRLLVHIRNHNSANSRETIQSESSDGGLTWSAPQSIGVWGLPSHLLRLRDGRLLMSYGHRREPFGNQARLSEDHGRSWSAPLIISEDGASRDLGYPSTVELPGRSFLTIWYELPAGGSRAVLRQARWSMEG